MTDLGEPDMDLSQDFLFDIHSDEEEYSQSFEADL